MEAARVMALRGHDVTLYEKRGLPWWSAEHGRPGQRHGDLRHPRPRRVLQDPDAKRGVKVNSGSIPRPSNDKLRPDVVVIAVGGLPAVLDIPGIDGKNVVSSSELQKKTKLALRLTGTKAAGV
jgi:2,4-dienoyl-CoA reductase (NADPH2)